MLPRRIRTVVIAPATLSLLVLLLAGAPAPARLDAERLSQALGERLEMRLFHALAVGARMPAPKPLSVWLRPHDACAQRNLMRAGLDELPLQTWTPIALEPPLLADILSASGSLEVRLAPRHQPLGRRSLRAVDAAAVHAGGPGPAGVARAPGYLGRNVLVGLVDTGIDPYHPAFVDEDGHTRVVAIWDQDAKMEAGQHAPMRRPEGFDYGALCDAATLRAGKCAMGDPQGHGTHVAGIAAGHAHLIGGVAPGASLAVVRSDGFERIADAVLFLVRLAEARNQLLVVNISVGGHYGPHDGFSPLEQFLARHSGKGRFVVAAAGNEGDRPLHVSLGGHGQAEEVRLALMRAPIMPLHQPHPEATALLELWGEHQFAERIAIELWHQGRCIMRKPLGLGEDKQRILLGNRPVTALRARRERPKSWGGDTKRKQRFVGLSVAIEPVDDLLEEMGVALVLAVELTKTKGSTRLGTEESQVEGWLSAVDGSTAPLIFAPPPQGAPASGAWAMGDARSTVAIPASGAAVLSVASSTVQRSWFDSAGRARGVPHETLGALSTFSSLGPVPWGAPPKPELCAPGSVVVSARGAAVADGPDTLGPITMVMQGTSMAAPHVAGTVALMFEAAGALGPKEVRQILLSTARPAPIGGPMPHPGWGFGQLDAYAAVRAAEARGGGCQQSPRSQNAASVAILLAGALYRASRRAGSKRP